MDAKPPALKLVICGITVDCRALQGKNVIATRDALEFELDVSAKHVHRVRAQLVEGISAAMLNGYPVTSRGHTGAARSNLVSN
jgi:hypothetical protein